MDKDGALSLLNHGGLVLHGSDDGLAFDAQPLGCLDVWGWVLQVLVWDDGEVGGLEGSLFWGPQEETGYLRQDPRPHSGPLLGVLPAGEGHAHTGEVNVTLHGVFEAGPPSCASSYFKGFSETAVIFFRSLGQKNLELTILILNFY